MTSTVNWRQLTRQNNVSTDDDNPILGYGLVKKSGQIEIRNKAGRTIMVCRDQASAAHYLSLLNEAFQAGYKLGHRDGRKPR